MDTYTVQYEIFGWVFKILHSKAPLIRIVKITKDHWVIHTLSLEYKYFLLFRSVVPKSITFYNMIVQKIEILKNSTFFTIFWEQLALMGAFVLIRL